MQGLTTTETRAAIEAVFKDSHAVFLVNLVRHLRDFDLADAAIQHARPGEEFERAPEVANSAEHRPL